MATINWGIIGAGWIADRFVEDLLGEKDNDQFKHVVKHIGASSKAKADKFVVDTCRGRVSPKTGTYADVIADPDVEVVYIALPHTMHYQLTLDALNGGKHVLCEKPIAMNYAQTREMIDLARSKNLFLMEAVWTRYFPIITELKELVHVKKVIGDVERGFFDYSHDADLAHQTMDSRLKNPKLGAGGLYDIGVYCFNYWRVFLDTKLGKDAVGFKVKSWQTIENGLDLHTSAIILQDDGKQAIITSTFTQNNEEYFAKVIGSKGTLYIGGKESSEPVKYKIVFREELNLPPIEKTVPIGGTYGFIHEANEVGKCLTGGKKESALMPWDESLLISKVMSDVRKENGLTYPGVKYDDQL